LIHVKICGLTNLADARAALLSGANLLGFNFYRPSPRYVEPTHAAQIIAALRTEFGGRKVSRLAHSRRHGREPCPGGRKVSRLAHSRRHGREPCPGERVFRCVGVLVNMPLADAAAIRLACGLDLLQLHGDEAQDYCQALAPYAFKALRPRSAADAEEGVARFGALAGTGEPRFLIDASHPQLYGGTGATGDWSIGRSIAERFPILLAGGLTPTNVAEAIRAVQPWGVDVASGVERAPGLKDPEKIVAFIQAARMSEG
jgi:phosphoribosylanthranilate isomerase